MRTCFSCWWQEGDLCYEGDFAKLPDGRSCKPADKLCSKYKNKRSVLGQYIPNDKLIIVSERKDR